MKIDVVSTINEVKQEDLLHKTVVVLDVLRASSTILTALFHGCEAVRTVETIGQAMQFKHSNTILAGERNCNKIQGFALNNSPKQLMEKASLSSHYLVLTTTNGTRAIQKALKAENILIGCFLNGHDCVQTALKKNKDITLLCAGSRDTFALEDGLAAGFFIDELKKHVTDLQLGDLGEALHLAFVQAQPNLLEIIYKSATAKRLIRKGFMEDVNYCCQINQIPLTPIYKNGYIISSEKS